MIARKTYTKDYRRVYRPESWYNSTTTDKIM